MSYPVDVQKIISMIIQDLRHCNHGALVDIIKKAEYSLEYVDHDSWNGGIDYCKLQLHLKYADFSKIIPVRKSYEETLTNSLNSFVPVFLFSIILSIFSVMFFPTILPLSVKISAL